MFSVSLRLPACGSATPRAFVDEIMRTVELEDLAHALVGLPGA